MIDITVGEIIVSFTGIGASTMLAWLLKDLRSLKKQAMTEEQHEDKCELAQANVKLEYREYLKTELKALSEDLKKHIDKRTNGNGKTHTRT